MNLSDKKQSIAKKMSKEELVARFKARQIAKYGGEKNYKRAIKEQRNRILSHKPKEYSEKDKSDFQKRTGRGFHE